MIKGLDAYLDKPDKFRRFGWGHIGPTYLDESVLYLPGPDPTDALVAVDCGVSPESLVAVEIDARRTNRLRRYGMTVINACIEDLLLVWPEPLQGAFLDLCCGLEESLVNKLVMAFLCNDNLKGTKCVINFQKGREHSRKILNKARKTIPTDHRGHLFLAYYNLFLETKVSGKVFQYASGVDMNSVAFTIADAGLSMSQKQELRLNLGPKKTGRSYVQTVAPLKATGIMRKINTCKAVRTKRKGFLPKWAV